MGRTMKCCRAIFCLSNQQTKKWISSKKSKQITDFHHKQSTQNDAVLVGKNCHGEDEEEDNRRAIAFSNIVSREDWAAVVVQSHFRGYLARRALRALRSLVKLQALARGHLVRKQTASALRRLQALIRAQDKIRSGRVNVMSKSPRSRRKSSPFNYTGPTTPENSERAVRARNTNKNERLSSLKRNGTKLNSGFNHSQERQRTNRTRMHNNRNDERTFEHRSLTTDGEIIHRHAHSCNISLGSDQCCQSFSTSKDSITHQSVLSPSSVEVQSLSRCKDLNLEKAAFYTAADNSPRFCSSSSIGGNSSSCRRETYDTPTRSDGMRSCLSNYSDHPNYMAYTESSKAKVRSLSVPKQGQAHYETTSSTNRYSRSNSKTLNLHANFANNAYLGSGRSDMLGMPVRGDSIGFSGGLWRRY